MTEVTRTIRIGSSNGLHARPAKLFAQAVKDSGIPVTISKGSGAPVNAARSTGSSPSDAHRMTPIRMASAGQVRSGCGTRPATSWNRSWPGTDPPDR